MRTTLKTHAGRGKADAEGHLVHDPICSECQKGRSTEKAEQHSAQQHGWQAPQGHGEGTRIRGS